MLIQNAMNQLHVSAYWQYVLTGVLTLAAVAMYADRGSQLLRLPRGAAPRQEGGTDERSIRCVVDCATGSARSRWDVKEQALYWVDIEGRLLRRYRPATGPSTPDDARAIASSRSTGRAG